MAGTALLGRLTWQLAELREVVVETPGVKTLVFDVPGWPGQPSGDAYANSRSRSEVIPVSPDRRETRRPLPHRVSRATAD